VGHGFGCLLSWLLFVAVWGWAYVLGPYGVGFVWFVFLLAFRVLGVFGVRVFVFCVGVVLVVWVG